jgi:hypothetical protein
MARFFKFTPDMADFLRDHLTLSEWKLWSYFATLDPFGDQYVEAPPTLTVLSKCKVSKATYYRAIAKFQELELFDFQDKGFSFRNLKGLTGENNESGGVSPVRQESHGCDKNLTDETDGLTDENLSIYTEVKTFSDHPEGKSEFFEFFENTEDSQGETKAIAILIENKLELKKEKGSEARTTKSVQQRAFDWLPEGPWNLEGKLDPNFRDFVAHDWLKRFGGDIHSKQADVLAHFKKDPANLPIRWEQYQSEFLHRFENAQILIDNGVAIPETSQAKLIANQRAITQSLPQEMNPIASIAPVTVEPLPLTQGIVQSVELVAAIAPITSQLTAPADFVKNEDGHTFKVFKAPKPVEEPITPEQWEDSKKKLAALSNKFNFGKGSPREQSPSKGVTEDANTAIAREAVAKKQAYFDQLNEWINDPVLRDEAVKRVKSSDCYGCLFDEEGIPYQVIWCEEF